MSLKFQVAGGRWQVAVLLAALVLLTLSTPVLAQDDPAIPNDRCLLCHSDPALTMVLPSNEVLPVSMDPALLENSVHFELNCQDCHNDKLGYPHAEFSAPDYRSWQIQISQVCGNCHEDEALKRQESIHGRLLVAGRSEAATCIDCHGSHGTPPADWHENPAVPPAQEVDTCGSCHSVIADEYRLSVHGVAALEGNRDVATCSSCHPAHHIEDPFSAEFRLNAPELCGQCHADAALMEKYDVSTEVFDTYVADFHGTTVKIFEDISPDQPTNKAVCHDCHSAHQIMRPTDENSTVMEANLLATCQRCHPDANESFTASWMGHYPADWEHYPIVTAVDWFYKLLIPGVLGFFVVFIGLDVSRTVLDRSRQRRQWRQRRRDAKRQAREAARSAAEMVEETGTEVEPEPEATPPLDIEPTDEGGEA